MSAAEALKVARSAGIRLGIDGESLTLEASVAPPTAVLDLLSADIVALLRSANEGWSTEDWLAFYRHRAGIAELNGGLSRADAEAHAFGCCVSTSTTTSTKPAKAAKT